MVVQWLGLHVSTVMGRGSIPGQGTKILHPMQCGLNENKPHTSYQNLRDIAK